MNDVSVLYYTANVEDPDFEDKIRKNILRAKGDLPLISVSQKPLPGFGRNICVGKHDCCYSNEFRQIQIGLKEIRTPYVVVAEADFLYPPEYFQFKPPERNQCYRYSNVWVSYTKSTPQFLYKKFSDGAQMIDRLMWLENLNEVFSSKKFWFSKEDKIVIPRIKTDKRMLWTSKNPAVTFKTAHNINPKTTVRRRSRIKTVLPYWGEAEELRSYMFHKKSKQILNATHLPILVRVFEESDGDILELGGGHFSTTVLRWLTEMSGRKLYTYENSERWYQKISRNESGFHKVILVDDWSKALIERPWGLALIDHRPASRRQVDILRLAEYAQYIVVHDTEPESDHEYHYSKVFPYFKHVINCSKYRPHTTILSNFKDVSKWGEFKC